VPGQSAREQIDEQLASNLSAVGHAADFASHRERLTALVAARGSGDASLRLCVLGAGNSNDLDLEQVAGVYREIHLVDIDRAALERARARQSRVTQARISCHAPVDLSGLFDRIDNWKRMQVTIEELSSAPHVASGQIVKALPGPFDVVVSACLLTQLQLAMLNVLTDRHQLFQAVRLTLNLIHMRTLVRLLAPAGRGLLVTDLTSNTTYSFDRTDPKSDLLPLVAELSAAGNVIFAAHPGQLAAVWRDDPFLSRESTLSGPLDAWLWHNGPERTFLVYAAEITRISSDSAGQGTKNS
jgi:hypothetical protein